MSRTSLYATGWAAIALQLFLASSLAVPALPAALSCGIAVALGCALTFHFANITQSTIGPTRRVMSALVGLLIAFHIALAVALVSPLGTILLGSLTIPYLCAGLISAAALARAKWRARFSLLYIGLALLWLAAFLFMGASAVLVGSDELSSAFSLPGMRAYIPILEMLFVIANLATAS